MRVLANFVGHIKESMKDSLILSRLETVDSPYGLAWFNALGYGSLGKSILCSQEKKYSLFEYKIIVHNSSNGIIRVREKGKENNGFVGASKIMRKMEAFAATSCNVFCMVKY